MYYRQNMQFWTFHVYTLSAVFTYDVYIIIPDDIEYGIGYLPKGKNNLDISDILAK